MTALMISLIAKEIMQRFVDVRSLAFLYTSMHKDTVTEKFTHFSVFVWNILMRRLFAFNHIQFVRVHTSSFILVNKKIYIYRKPQQLLEQILLVTRFHYAPARRYFCCSLLVKFSVNKVFMVFLKSWFSWQLAAEFKLVILNSFHTTVSTPTLHR